MNKEGQTWRERQQEHKCCLATYNEQTVVLRQQLEACQQHISEMEARIQAQKQQSKHRLFHWLLNRQLKRLNRQRQETARMLDDIACLELSQQELEKEIEKPPPVHLRRIRVIYLTPEMLFFSLLAGLIGWLVSHWLLHG